MKALRNPMTTRRRTVHTHHGHSKTQCLKILRGLSAYLDNDPSASICKEIRKHLGACPNCETFVSSLRQTITLCRHATAPSLTRADKARLRREILKAAS